MAVFPVLELGSFVVACVAVSDSLGLAILFGLLSAVALNFSLHITYHYHVHHPSPTRWVDALRRMTYSVLMGLPFHFYRTLHINHHIYDNGPGDVTTTWREENGAMVARGALAYTLLWPFRGHARHLLKSAKEAGYFKDTHRARMRAESAAIFACVALLAWLDWGYVALYYGVFYVGWSLINLHNYGQHLPRERQLELGNSFYGRLYNLVFVNNGLHYEHHKEPDIPYWDLAELPYENSCNVWPHTVDGVRFDLAERRKPDS